MCAVLAVLTSTQLELYYSIDWMQDTQFYLSWLQYLLFLKLGLYSRLGPTQPGQDRQWLTDEHLQTQTHNSISHFHLTNSDTAAEDEAGSSNSHGGFRGTLTEMVICHFIITSTRWKNYDKKAKRLVILHLSKYHMFLKKWSIFLNKT